MIRMLFGVVICLITGALLFSIIPSVGSQIETGSIANGKIDSVDVYFNEEGTDAELFKVAVYTIDGDRIAVSNDGSVTGGSWCTARFPSNVILTNGIGYIFMVSADGNYSVGGDDVPGYTSENLTAYGAFPVGLGNPDSGVLNIRSHFV